MKKERHYGTENRCQAVDSCKKGEEGLEKKNRVAAPQWLEQRRNKGPRTEEGGGKKTPTRTGEISWKGLAKNGETLRGENIQRKKPSQNFGRGEDGG